MSGNERNNSQWLDDLSSSGRERERALGDLRSMLVSGLRRALAGWAKSVGREFESLIEDFSQEALLRILNNLDSFQGKSRFVTWAGKVAIRAALTELRRKRWQDVSLESIENQQETGSLFLTDPGAGPEKLYIRSAMLEAVHRLIWTELTERQRRAMNAVLIHGMPLEEAAKRMSMNRNAMYKLLHDGRIKLKQQLDKKGIDPDQLLQLFE